jgi:hypothetical protein
MQEGIEKKEVGVKDFSTGDKTPYLASGFLSHPRSSDDAVDTLKKHIHFNHRN